MTTRTCAATAGRGGPPQRWLNGGVPPAQVAEWAGHSVAVLLKVYAKCIDGQDQIAKRRIEDALRESDDGAAASGDDDGLPGCQGG